MWLENPLATERLVLRAPQAEDGAALVHLKTDPEVRRYLGGPVPEDQAWAQLRANRPGQTWGNFILASAQTQAVIGQYHLTPEDADLELSYAVLPEYWHQGLSAEGLACALAWAAGNSSAKSVSAWTQEANRASVVLLERLGFQLSHRFVRKGAQQVTMTASLAGFAIPDIDRQPSATLKPTS